MNRILSAVFAFLLATAASAQEEKIKAVVERYDASFTMASQSVGTYKVNKRVRVLDKDAADQADHSAQHTDEDVPKHFLFVVQTVSAEPAKLLQQFPQGAGTDEL